MGLRNSWGNDDKSSAWVWLHVCGGSMLILSKWTPKYLVVIEVEISILLKETRGQIPCCRVKVIWQDLVSFIFTLQILHHDSIVVSWAWNLFEAVNWFSWVDMIALASAYSMMKVLMEVCWSAINMLNRRGAIIASCGILDWILERAEMEDSKLTIFKVRFED